MAIDTSPNTNSSVVQHYTPAFYAWSGGVMGMLFPLAAWVADFVKYAYPIDPISFIEMHLSNPLHFVVDTAPFVLSTVFFLFAKANQRRLDELRALLDLKSVAIQRNVELAKKIGNAEFAAQYADLSQLDELGHSLLMMHRNLEENTQKEYQQNWIARGKELISDVLRKYSDISSLAYHTLVRLTEYTDTIQGSFYLFDENNQVLENIASYAYNRRKYPVQRIHIGQGLVGQAAYEMAPIYRREIPEDYMTITSGILGHKKPSALVIVPLISDDKLQGIIELASLADDIPQLTRTFLDELSSIVAQTIFNLKANRRTTELLNESRKMTIELQKREEILRRNAEDMQRAQAELEISNRNLETQIQEVERGQTRLYSLLENASEVISIYDETGIVKYESPSATAILGYEPDKTMGKNAFQIQTSILHSLTYERFLPLLEDSNVPHTFEITYYKPTGEQLWLEAVGRNLLNNQAIQGILFNTRDITLRKIAEQAQRMSGEMQALSENSVDIIIRLSLDATFYYVNPTITLYTGINKTDIIKHKLDKVDLPIEFVRILDDTMQRVLDRPVNSSAEFEFVDVQGLKRIMQLNSIPEFNEGMLETVLFVAHDITQQKAIEAEISEKNKAISDSINYAQRIQSAIIPDTRIMSEYFPESFIFYRPKDVVSGDFPWLFAKNKDVIFIAAVDCTGHGVPGALLSFVGYFLLNNIVDHDTEQTAGKVLDLLHVSVQKTLRQDKEGANARDGMDIALLRIDKSTRQVQFAGAHRPLIQQRGETLTDHRGTKKSIGGIPSRKGKDEDEFQNYVVSCEPGDRLFFYSDGLPDQVGGERNRKYQTQRLRDNILHTAKMPMQNVLRFFTNDFDEWKGDNKQIDDVLFIGIEL